MYSDLFKPTYLQHLCQECGLRPSKHYGQNYLIQNWPVEKIIEGAKLKKTDTVIEVGPGFGVLTIALAEKVKRVIAFEIEKKLEKYWEKELKDLRLKIKDCGDIEIIWGNALSNLQSLIFNLKSGYKVVANIPYQITSDLLRTLLELENKPESITLMVQKEVAERICAKKGDMSLLAVSVQYFGKPEIVAKVGKGNFWPSPKVDSAVLHIETINQKNNKSRKQGDCDIDKEFFRVVKVGFSSKRKQLWGNLSKGLALNGEKVKKVLLEVVGNEKVRAEEVGVEEWREIVAKLHIT